MARTYLDKCSCGSGKEAPQHLDGHGIFLTYACEDCWPRKLKGFRPDILEAYEADEPIDPED